jgi:hypothetical protein
MRSIPAWLIVIIAVVIAVLGGRAISAQDKYTVQIPNGLAFSEFRGYEDWQVVSVSQTEDLLKVMVANPVMIDAYNCTMLTPAIILNSSPDKWTDVPTPGDAMLILPGLALA